MANLIEFTKTERDEIQGPLLEIRGVSKVYGSVRAVDRLSIHVQKGEVLTLLGPSGCGKSTTMRLIMGLERCDEGEISYRGELLDSAERAIHVPVHKRKMGMVFQSYAIWPHMTVFENVAYPLRLRNFRAREVREAVSHVLSLVGLEGFEDRPSPNLSGGQQQRVALARSLVFEPDILLLDEPFSNLDARLREQMRTEVRILQRRLGITVVFVTHDQIEALSLSDRIAVMNSGRIEQIGTPQELYNLPGTPAVRDFLGRTAMVNGRVGKDREDGMIAVELEDGQNLLAVERNSGADLAPGDRCSVAIRPEKISVVDLDAPSDLSSCNLLSATIEVLLFVGERYEARLLLQSGESIPAFLPPTARWREGQDLSIHFPPSEVQVWPA